MQEWNHAVGVSFDDSASSYRVTAIRLALFRHGCSSYAAQEDKLVLDFRDFKSQKIFLHKFTAPTYFLCGEIYLFGFPR